jgi:hypothetical protein
LVSIFFSLAILVGKTNSANSSKNVTNKKIAKTIGIKILKKKKVTPNE